ncbi:MAG: galactokinase [Paludibacteraceae bacterium]|mgnify:FL=1|nr:galactokinase [Paludibacteraceae bacterium]OPZ01890.1 MAG: Galactokinase [Bacteroidetes bacterium ADurb.BinA395]HPL76729.1 galactokinase [Paludibacteraceae bacterium]HPQ12697.1 galactokinase [Paludibacteraceae bacterium]
MTQQELKSAFEKIYGQHADAVYFAPGRVNLIGEHTDYNGGYVFPCALSFGTYLLIRKNGGNTVRFRSLNQPDAVEVPLEKLTTRLENSWANYLIGVFAQFIKKGVKIDEGFDILIWGDVPTGAGLSSSASLEVVTAYALNDQLGTGYDRTELALMSQKAEHEFALVNCGIMDQFAAAQGKKDHAIFLNCDTLEFDLVPVKLNGIKVLISNTHSPHKLDSGAYNQRVAECKKAVEQLNKVRSIKYLAELTEEEFKKIESAITDETAKKRARHVVSEVQRTKDAVKALRAGDILQFGKLMNASHVSLRDDYEVTGPELDTMVEEAWKIDGVIGSRMTGGGFGGCTVSLVKDEAIDTFIKNVGAAYEAKIGIKPEFYIAEIGDGACRLS